ncbi:MAG: pentapeptide repeat-containing protein [Ignavibacteria bacterium]|nr:pentapeptide repeat-containing protein [Ignavibacteria bacterium]MBZ0195907.1 pentapeptide repeat-containing protein [Ignavibacteriaceae bacterium]
MAPLPPQPAKAKNSISRIIFERINLTGANLEGVNFKVANLSSANFKI